MSDFGNDEAMKLPSFGVFCAQIVKDLIYFRRNAAISFDVLIKQIYFTSVEALGLCTLLSLLLGAVIIVEGHQILAAIGQTDWIYKILIFALIRDLGPFIICLVVVARSGTAISTELGNMKVNKEIDALVTMGISPISYLVSPRVVGMIVSLLILMSYFLMSGIFGGFLISNLFQNIPFLDFFARLLNELSLADIVIMFFKLVLSGFYIAAICSYQGLSAQTAYTEVPQRNIKAVGGTVISVCLVNLIGSLLYFFVTGLNEVGI